MSSTIESERLEESSSSPKPSYKHSKYDEPFPEEDQLEDELRLFDEEWDKSDGFDADLSKLSYTFGAGSVDLEDDDLASELESGTNRDLMNELSKMAISYYNETTGTSLELVDVLRANYHPSAAITYYITFRANDPSDGIQAKEFRAIVRYLWLYDSEAFSCVPRPC